MLRDRESRRSIRSSTTSKGDPGESRCRTTRDSVVGLGSGGRELSPPPAGDWCGLLWGTVGESSPCRAAIGDAEPMDQYRRGELVFDVIDAGPIDGPVVVLLHGFPQSNTSWNAVIERLTAQ